ncbi:MAG: adenylate kinase [Clostridia bacterium]|nr:adenylate kinase [Clostridia bacterium]
MQLILLGPPGSGKGTLASEISKTYGIAHISSGDLFRKHIENKTELGLAVQDYLKQGALVPDDLTIEMLKERLEQPDCENGFLLDGFPRTKPQAEALETLLIAKKRPLTAVINVIARDETILKRLSGRCHCPNCGRGYNLYSMPPKKEGICDDCGYPLIRRDDDQEETVRERLKVYKEQTEPLIDYYRQKGLLIEVDNEGSIEESLNDVRRKLEKQSILNKKGKQNGQS